MLTIMNVVQWLPFLLNSHQFITLFIVCCGVVVGILHCIWEVPGSNLVLKTGYPI